MRSIALLGWAPALLQIACWKPVAGSPMAVIAKAPVTEIRTDQQDGLRVLWHGRGAVADNAAGAWFAANEREFHALWKMVGVAVPPPAIDFGRQFVVAAIAEEHCSGEIVSARRDDQDVVSMAAEPPSSVVCNSPEGPLVQIVALPERFLPAHFVFVPYGATHGYAFDRPPRRSGSPAAPEPSVEERAPRGPWAGVVELPARNHLWLRKLDDGSEVWVVHHADGSASVIAGDIPSRNSRHRIWWDRHAGRFMATYDSYGRNVNGGPPLPVRSFVRLADDRLQVDGLGTPLPLGPIEPRGRSPKLQDVVQ